MFQMDATRAITCILIVILIGMQLVKSESAAGKTSENQTAEAIEPINVIVLTYSRSGSSFAGELFSSHPAASYIFEPLYYPAMIIGNATPEAYKDVITKLLTCDTTMLDEVRDDPIMIMIRKFGSIKGPFLKSKYSSQQATDLCKADAHRVMKTIRLRLPEAFQLLTEGNIPNLRIVHLVRDPRARYNSVMDKTGSWNPRERKVDAVCVKMETDLRLAEALPSSKYKLVKYEDLVANPNAVAKDIYANMYGLQTLPEETMRYIQSHAKLGNATDGNYYSTIRDKKFVPDHWEHDLNQTTIEMLQNNPSCKYVIDKLNYTMKQFK